MAELGAQSVVYQLATVAFIVCFSNVSLFLEKCTPILVSGCSQTRQHQLFSGQCVKILVLHLYKR